MSIEKSRLGVTFSQHDPADIHTVTFGPGPYSSKIEKTFAGPQGKLIVFNPLGWFPSEPPGPPSPISYDGTSHGNGYLNSGILFPQAAKGQPHAFKVTFTKAGVYHFECVNHAHMDGTIVVK